MPSSSDHSAEQRRLVERLREFRDARGWREFHSPNRLAAAISIEAAEVLEHFLWVDDAEADATASAKREEIAEEIADVLIYLIYLADRLGIDLFEAADLKINRNEVRFPISPPEEVNPQRNG